MLAGIEPEFGAGPRAILETTEGATASAVGSAGTLRAGFKTPGGEIDWDEIWRRMPQPVQIPRLSFVSSSGADRIDVGDATGSVAIVPTAGALAGDKRGSSLSGARVSLLPEGGQGHGGEGGGAGSLSTLQSARKEVRQSLALTPQAGFGETTLQGDGTRGGKTISAIGPFGSGTAANAAASGLVSVKAGTLDHAGRARVVGERDAAPPLPAQIAAAVQGAGAAREAAGSLLAQSRRDEQDAAALRIEAQKAAIPPEPLGDLSPLGIQRLEDGRRTLAARAVDCGLAGMRASRDAAVLTAEADSSDATAFRLMTRWLGQEPGPMEGAALYSAMIEASSTPPPRPANAARRIQRPPRGPVAPPAASPPPAAAACCASCATKGHEHHEPTAHKGGCGCGSKRDLPLERPPAHWSPGAAAVGPESPPMATRGNAGKAVPVPRPAVIVPEVAVMRCGEGRVLRPLSSFVDCAWPNRVTFTDGGRDVIEPPQALSPASRSAFVPRPMESGGLPAGRGASRTAVATDGSGAVCRLPGGVRLPLFSWAPLCPAPVHEPGTEGAKSITVGPMQTHQGGGASSTYHPPRQCHCECFCKFGGGTFTGPYGGTPVKARGDDDVGLLGIWGHPSGRPFPPGRLPPGGCVHPADALMSTDGAGPPLVAGDCRAAVLPPLAHGLAAIDPAYPAHKSTPSPERRTTGTDRA